MEQSEQKKLFTTAVVIIPPDEIWEPIQQIRKQNDKAYERWMPHINLLFPFIIPENFHLAAETASKALSVIEPFEMVFDCVNHFSHGKSSVLWLHPSETEKVRKVQSLLCESFPYCTELSTKSAEGFTPHLTLGQAASHMLTKSKNNFTQTLTKSNLFTTKILISSIHMISRIGNTPFSIHYTIPFGGGEFLIFWSDIRLYDSRSDIRRLVTALYYDFYALYET